MLTFQHAYSTIWGLVPALLQQTASYL